MKEDPPSTPWHSTRERYKILKPFSRANRSNMPLAEVILWQHIRNKQVLGYKFRRQHVFGNFIVDFYCHDLRLIIEVDGVSHENQKEYDQERTEYLEGLDLRVIRFRNEDVISNLPAVMDELEMIITRIACARKTK